MRPVRFRPSSALIPRYGLLLLVAGCGDRPSHPPPSRDPAAPVAEWPAWGGDGGISHFTPLDEIAPGTVGALRVAWTYRTGDVSDGNGALAGTNFEATPIMVDGTLFVATPTNRVVALDAESGVERWTFDPHLDRKVFARYGSTASRGVATWLDSARASTEPCRRRIFLATFDARLIALDAAGGARCPDFGASGEVNLRTGVRNVEIEPAIYRVSSAPSVARDLVIVGSSIVDNRRVDSPSGVVRAFDARTGRLRWSWEPLRDTASIRSGAANAWSTIAVDEARDLVFVPTGAASPDHYGGLRPGANLYSSSVVALKASTGRVAWHFQLVHHDLWDYDASAPPTLFSMRRDGRVIPALVQGTKTGFLFFFNRETGEPLFPIEERAVPATDVPQEQTWPTQPAPVRPPPLVPQTLRAADAWGLTFLDRNACRKRIETLRNDGMYTPPSVRGTLEFPGFIGGINWGGVAVDDARDIVVTNTNRLATVVTLVPRSPADSEPVHNDPANWLSPVYDAPFAVRRAALRSPLGVPCNPPPWGTLVAVRASTGDVLWERPLGGARDYVPFPVPERWGSPMLGGPLVTASGLVFIAAGPDHRLRAFDVETGRELWRASLPASAQASAMSYRARRGGRQLIVIAAGGHAEMQSRLGDYVVAFALP
ncbi:MAG: pyrroloquinoline quinone-dependent dehydrogenase [Gemmatimonadales bacterium]